MPLRCVDLFCGAGGFSEGFRQAGIDVAQGFDLWPPAFVTHKKNHGGRGGIRDVVQLRPEDVGDVDVLIGSPPCTEFSFSNRGGGGDLEAGLLLVRHFLRLVHLVRPKWWVMENVPRTMGFLGPEVPLRQLGIAKLGTLEIPTRALLASADYGIPQQRVRAFVGNFPIPPPTHDEGGVSRRPWRSLGEVLAALGDPEHGADGPVRDPVYGFELASQALTDHYSATLRLTHEEVREVQKAKTDHSWYGRMSFPDRLDRPARTVMATQLRVSRETIVVPTADGHYRRLSVREMASCMGFPITYQFWGRTEAIRYKLVGNAVAPPVAYAVARAILEVEHVRGPRGLLVHRVVAVPAPPVSEVAARRRSLPLTRRFRAHVPGCKVPGFRVDLDNQGARRNGHLVTWRAVLYRGGGKSLESRVIQLRDALRLLERSAHGAKAQRFARAVERELRRVPDASTLQRIRAERELGEMSPFVVLERIGAVVAEHFGDPVAAHKNGGQVPPRIAAALVATSYACAVANGERRALRLALPAQAGVTRTRVSERARDRAQRGLRRFPSPSLRASSRSRSART